MATTFTEAMAGERTVDSLAADLAQADVHVRAQARAELARRGAQAVPPLLRLLDSHAMSLRWEAAKTLAMIGDPAATDALIRTLDDPEHSVRWLAAEALVAIGPASVRPLLGALTAQGDDACLLAGAHHVLAAFRDATMQPVLAALEGPLASLEAPLAAYHALEKLGR